MTAEKTQEQSTPPPCPLCDGPDLRGIHHQNRHQQRYFLCGCCDLIFLHPGDHPSLSDEWKRYKVHQNSKADPEYLNWLRPVAERCKLLFPTGFAPKVLDFGCGPGPVLSTLLEDHVWSVDMYDPFFYPQTLLCDGSYDLVIATEVWEHFREPKISLQQLVKLLKPDGYLFSMTQFHQGPEHFQTWWYARDLTHLCFYSEKTFRWIATSFNLECFECKKSSVIFRKD